MHPTITTLQAELGKLRTDESIARKGDSASDQLRADGLKKEIKKLELKLEELLDQANSGDVNEAKQPPTAFTEDESKAALINADIKIDTDEVHQAADALKAQEVASEPKNVIQGLPVPSAVKEPKNKVKATKKIAKKTIK